MDYKGVRWYKSDLHLHTPASRCFRDRGVTPEQWVQRCIDQGLDVVAITDHNTGEYIDRIKEAAANTNLTVFPGVEVTCSESKVHMLVIFEKDKSTQYVEDFLVSIGIERDRFAADNAFSRRTTIEIANIVKEKGGIIIPAHIDEFNGICNISPNSREELLSLSNIDGVQVVHKMFLNSDVRNEDIEPVLLEYYGKNIDHEIYRGWKTSVRQAVQLKKAILTFSDNPHEHGDSKHGLWGIGQRYTWIKMGEEINLESLRQALLLPEHRIKNDFESENHPYTLPNNWIKSLKVSNTELNESDFEISFNPQMTTIIGGRGTGKSSVVRFIRGLFDMSSDLKGLSSLQNEQVNFFKLKDGDDGVLKKDSEIEVILVRFRQQYKIIMTEFEKTSSKKTVFYKFDDDTKEFKELEESNLLESFKLDIFSQKQIYEIAKNPNALRERIDAPIYEIDETKIELFNIKKKFMEQSAKIRRIESEISRKSKVIADINEKKELISSFKESGFEDLIRKFKEYSSQRIELMNFVKDLEDKKNHLSSIVGKMNLSEKPDITNFNPQYHSELDQIVNETVSEYSQINLLIEEAERRITALINEYNTKIKDSEWRKKYGEISNQFNTTKEDMARKGIDDLSKLEKTTLELSSLESNLRNISTFEETLSGEIEKNDAIKEQYFSRREEITVKRREFIRSVIGGSDNIKIEVKPYRDKRHFTDSIRTVLQKFSGFDEDINKIVRRCLHGQDVNSNISLLVEEFIQIRNENAGDTEFTGRMINVIKALNDEQIDELSLLIPEDEISVKYKPNGSSEFRVLTNASAGQKTSAILTFLLSFGEVPLILDQPEDDLDNHLIYDLIVERLKKTKEKRQIIVVTHNANIPVNGDSELVLCMDSETSGIKVLCEGPVENDSVRTEICGVMEGGEDAFKLRSRRYNIN
ncbi:MAG: AAA family ATPase [Exiguobacterium sp.]|uniref:TrlF family AAA-like ATPase n=1 Tax=Exiguobacterium sp. TaxID=44751 RepID=UPI00258017BD|nr:AAA family ATPase [Exiguobacterium sp.]MBQ6458998.1 AAA family ATPase [Exiguobacterium sp.]